MTWDQHVREMIELEEGRRSFPYKDTRGFVTIGIGRNLMGKPLSDEIVEMMYAEDVAEAQAAAIAYVGESFWKELTEARRLALVNMAFQMGRKGLFGFKKMLSAMKQGYWREAAKEALRSEWALQTPKRAARVARMIQTGICAYVFTEECDERRKSSS